MEVWNMLSLFLTRDADLYHGPCLSGGFYFQGDEIYVCISQWTPETQALLVKSIMTSIPAFCVVLGRSRALKRYFASHECHSLALRSFSHSIRYLSDPGSYFVIFVLSHFILESLIMVDQRVIAPLLDCWWISVYRTLLQFSVVLGILCCTCR